MKYIRTKDGILENTIITKPIDFNGEKIYPIPVINGVYEKDVVKQADTIEELCDEFVGVVGNMHRQLTRTNIKSWNDHIIYGAIWTDKGLIYVAKMNEKGELELL